MALLSIPICGPRLCAGPRCLTSTPRRLCQFCARTAQLAAEGTVKPCLRCSRVLPLTDFAANGRFRVCDRCRDEAPMTDAERRVSKFLSRSDPKVRRERYRQLRRAA